MGKAMDSNRTYRVMPRAILNDGDLSIRTVEPNAIEQIRLWRNAQLSVLRQVQCISAEEQQRYFASVIWPDLSNPTPTNILLSFFEGERMIGYGGLVHIQWLHHRAEVSFLFDPVIEAETERASSLLAGFLGLLRQLAFEDLGLNRLTTETYDTRAHIIPTLESVGFEKEGLLRAHVIKDGRVLNATLHGCLKDHFPTGGR